MRRGDRRPADQGLRRRGRRVIRRGHSPDRARPERPARRAGARRRAATKRTRTPPPRRAGRAKKPAGPVAVENGAAHENGGQLGQVIANHVRARRLEIGLNVGQLAERTGISKGMLSKIENAQTSPSLSTLERLAGALDMPVTSLFRGLAEERDAVFVKAGSGPEIVRKGTRAGHTYELLGSLRGPYKRGRTPARLARREHRGLPPLPAHGCRDPLHAERGDGVRLRPSAVQDGARRHPAVRGGHPARPDQAHQDSPSAFSPSPSTPATATVPEPA